MATTGRAKDKELTAAATYGGSAVSGPHRMWNALATLGLAALLAAGVPPAFAAGETGPGGALGAVAATSVAGDVNVHPTAVQASTLNYDIDAALSYIDELQRPDLRLSVQPGQPGHDGSGGVAGAAVSSVAQPRTVGLRRLRLGLDWQAPNAAGLFVVLRPDADNRTAGQPSGTIAHEFDDRAGDPGMKPQPSLRLIDAYQLRLQPAPELNVGIGVWEGLTATPAAYPELLGFGLNILFPAKFAGVRLHLQKPRLGPDTAVAAGPGAQPTSFSLDFTVFEGDEDRAETLGAQHSSFDQAPVANDPYHGGAAAVSWRLGRQLNLGLMTGYLLQADGPGTYDEVFGQLTAIAFLPAFGQDLKLGLDLRYQRTRGRDLVADQTLQSAMATASYPVASELWALAGIDLGKGDRWQDYQLNRQTTVALAGYQLEAGLLRRVGQNLSLQLMLSREYRTLRAGGVTNGGFQDATGNRSQIQRMGLELTYKLNQNA